jgi:hypothetical protein
MGRPGLLVQARRAKASSIEARQHSGVGHKNRAHTRLKAQGEARDKTRREGNEKSHNSKLEYQGYNLRALPVGLVLGVVSSGHCRSTTAPGEIEGEGAVG